MTHAGIRVRGWLVGWIGFAGLACAYGQSFAPITYEARRATGSVVLDGQLDEPAWAAADRIDRFSIYQQGTPAAQPVVARVLWDDAYVYAGFELRDADLWALTGHDAYLWESDVAELFFQPTPGAGPYYELEISPQADALDLHWLERLADFEGAKAYESNLEAVVHAHGTIASAAANDPLHDDLDEGWTLEFRVPRASLAPFAPGDEWGFLASAADYPRSPGASTLQFTSLLPAPYGFHTYERWERLAFVDEPLLAGDADGDGVVGLADFGLLKAHFGQPGTRHEGEFTRDRQIDLADFGVLKENFGRRATAVPEPAALHLALAGVCAVVGGNVCTRRFAWAKQILSTLRLIMHRTFCVALCGLLLAPAALRADDPLSLGGDPAVDPNDFRITEFASGLNYPISMEPLSDGSLLVATSRPDGSSFFAATGELVRLVDANHDGVADSAPQVLYAGLPGGLTGMRRAGNLVFATSVKTGYNGISVLRTGASPEAPLTLLGSLDFTYPAGWGHISFTLATRPTPGQADHYDLAFNVGSQFNATPTVDSAKMSGLAAGELLGDSIYLTSVQDTGAGVEFGSFTQVARGLRNAAGLEFDPQNGALIFEDNGIDGLVTSFIPLSADELNVLPADQLGGSVEDYGFPQNYYEYNTGTFVGGKGEPSAVVFQPWPDPVTGSKSEGAFEIAVAPPDFPTGLNHGVFVGFHGNSGNANNDENPLVYADPTTGKYFHIVSSDQADVGHLNGLKATHDSLFVADMSRTGSIVAGAGQGVIYQIKSLVAGLPGDVDGNQQVDLSDFGILKANFGATAGRRQGDLNLDGKIDLSDFGVLKANFGQSEAAAVPEPSTAWLAFSGLLLLGGLARRPSRT